jgi:uncharacterized protein (TIGR00299 family) protein
MRMRKESRRILLVDCSIAGVSGDMMLGALIDLGANANRLRELSESIVKYVEGVKRLDIYVKDVMRRDFKAKKVYIDAVDEKSYRHGKELLAAIERITNALNLSTNAKELVTRITNILLEAEAKLHGESVEDVHLHEIGSVDTIVDIVGVALLLEDLGLLNTDAYATPVAIGYGSIKISHGSVSVPAPATLEILKKCGLLFFGKAIEAELATPTGIAILAGLNCKSTIFYPIEKVVNIGYGAGEKDFKEFPNIIRVIVGERIEALGFEDIIIIETDVDDVTGEVLGFLIEKLMSEGAKDAYIIPTYRKKNRPGYLIRVITDAEKCHKLIDILMHELGTLGVRYINYARHVAPLREIKPISININNKHYEVLVKISRDYKGNIIAVKPEYESIKAVSIATGTPMRKVMQLVYKKLSELGIA